MRAAPCGRLKEVPERSVSSVARKELRWLYNNCPAWGGHIARGQPVQVQTSLFRYLMDGLIQTGDGGYYLTRRGLDYAFSPFGPGWDDGGASD